MSSSSPSSSSSSPLQSISIVRTERRSTPSPPHTVYAILVSLAVRNWTIYRRYSEFLSLHRALSASEHGPPPFAFPPKHAFRKNLLVRSVLFTAGAAAGGGQNEQEEKERKEALENYLRGIVTCPNGSWREMDVFREFLEMPKSQPVRGGGGGGGGSSQASAAAFSGRQRQGQGYIPGSYSHGEPHTRHLGAAAAASSSSSPPQQAEETSATRVMTSQDLLDSQQAQFDQQDSHLNDLTAILRRQRQMGVAINQELLEQNELLDALDGEVAETQGRLTKNDGLMRKLG